MFAPSVTVTVYGACPPLTATLKFVELVAHIVASPLNTADGVLIGFNGCALDAVTVKHWPQITPPVTP